MHCHICDKELSDKETIYNDDLQGYEPCSFCLDAAMEAAYCDGFLKEDDEYVLIEEWDPITEYDLPVSRV